MLVDSEQDAVLIAHLKRGERITTGSSRGKHISLARLKELFIQATKREDTTVALAPDEIGRSGYPYPVKPSTDAPQIYATPDFRVYLQWLWLVCCNSRNPRNLQGLLSESSQNVLHFQNHQSSELVSEVYFQATAVDSDLLTQLSLNAYFWLTEQYRNRHRSLRQHMTRNTRTHCHKREDNTHSKGTVRFAW